MPLPFRFLTSAVFAFFRPLQFWILTTQPLFLLFPFFLLLPHSGFRSAPIPLSLLRFSPFRPAWFPVHSFPIPVLGFSVCFLSPFPDSLPQLFLRCLPSDLSSGIFRSASVPFRSLPLPFRLLSLTVLSFPASCLCLTAASSVLRFFLSTSPFSTFSSVRFPVLLFRFLVLDLLLVSFRPALIHSRSRSSGDPLLNFVSGAGA